MTNPAAPLLTTVIYHPVRPQATRRFPHPRARAAADFPGRPDHRPAQHRTGPAVVCAPARGAGARLDTDDLHGRPAGKDPCANRAHGPRA